MHKIRISTARKLEIIEEATAAAKALKQHAATCPDCIDADVLCDTASDLYGIFNEKRTRQQRLIHIESEVVSCV